MKKSIILALVAALPTFAQQDTAPALPTPPANGAEMPRHWGAAGEMPARPNREDFQKKMLEKFDTNKDGQISEEEKAAMKAAMPKRGERPQGQRPGKGDKRGHRSERPQGDQFPGANGEMPQFPKGQFPGANGEMPQFSKGEVPGMINKRVPQIPQDVLEKMDTDKDGNVSQKELNAAYAKRAEGKRGEGKRGKRGDRGPKGPRGQKPAEAPAGEHTPVTLPL